jgi:hypothetical protein
MVHRAAYEKKTFIHTKTWNQILQLPGEKEKSERKARAVADKMIESFWIKLFNHLAETDDVFIMPMRLFHLKVVPDTKKNGFKYAMIPTENGLIHTKFVPYFIRVPISFKKYLFKQQCHGRIWSDYDIDIDVERALFRRAKGNCKKRVNRIRQKYGVQQPVCNA